MKKIWKQPFNMLIPCIIVLTVLFFVIITLGDRAKEDYKSRQLAAQEAGLDFSGAAPGFDELGFYDDEHYTADTAFFRLTEEDLSGVWIAYVPAEMSGKPLHLCLNSGEQLQIERISGEAPGDLDLSQYLDVPKENTDPDAAENKGGNAGSGSTDGDVSGHIFHAGDTLPQFAEGAPFTFTLLDSGGRKTDSRTVIFLYTENVPSMYINTESGSMEAVDNDKSKETSETADYRIRMTDGRLDAAGSCTIKGRGNSTWGREKHPYNLKLASEDTLLGMGNCTKYALLANYWDSTQTRQYYAFNTAEKLGLAYTPQEKFVNLYLNGRYQSLYLLSQRINVNGGTVSITNLDKKNKKANPDVDTDKDQPETVVLDQDKDGRESVAYAWPNEPDDISGGYLIEFQDRYKNEPCWFRTEEQYMTFKSPEMPSVGEYQYITGYIREAEAALFQEDKASSSPFRDYFDLDSWARMYLIQDFFVQSDDELYSFFFYKKDGDPLLYCGPVWDFDLCLGNMYCGDYYRTSAQTLWLRDGRRRWLHEMDQYPEFRERVAQIYLKELEPIIRNLLENEYDQTVDLLEKDTRLNYLRWHKDLDYRERTGRVRTLIETRVQFLHDFYTNPDSFHRLIFHFGWGHFSYYVKDGESMGFLPTHEYGENQSTHYEEKHGFITGWKDTESGQLLQAEEPINKDRDFRPIYGP